MITSNSGVNKDRNCGESSFIPSNSEVKPVISCVDTECRRKLKADNDNKFLANFPNMKFIKETLLLFENYLYVNFVINFMTVVAQ